MENIEIKSEEKSETFDDIIEKLRKPLTEEDKKYFKISEGVKVSRFDIRRLDTGNIIMVGLFSPQYLKYDPERKGYFPI